MKNMSGILVAILILSVMTQITFALEEGKDYTCVDREKNMASPPPITRHTVVDKNIEKVPLCSEGKVPKAVIQDKYESITDDTIFNIVKSNGTKETASCSSGLCYDWAYSYQDASSIGVFAYMTQHYPEMDAAKGVYSLASIGTGTPYSDRVEVGWRKRQGGVTALFVSWWKDGKPQCFDGSYCGFVQYSVFNYPGMKLNPSDGIPYEIQYNPGYNGDVGYWWITYNNDPVGYYPESLWNGQFRGASFVLYRGGVVSYAQVTTTDMGNGLWSSNPLAAKIYGQEYEDYDGWHNAYTTKFSTSTNLYSVTSTGSNSMRYGGPGTPKPGITVVSPNGGENWARGAYKTITWTKTGNPGTNVKIDLLKGGSLNRILTYGTPNDGSFGWTVPSGQTLGSDYKIRITSTSNSFYTDTSNGNFLISNPIPSIRVISPNGGESWARGTTKTITWAKTGNPGANVRIQLYKGSALVRTISTGTANDGSFSWPIPWTQAIGSDYKIKISSTTTSYNDWSNSNFRIY